MHNVRRAQEIKSISAQHVLQLLALVWTISVAIWIALLAMEISLISAKAALDHSYSVQRIIAAMQHARHVLES